MGVIISHANIHIICIISTHFKKALIFSICLKGILDTLTLFTLSGLMVLTSRHSTSPDFRAEAKVSPEPN